MDVLMKTSTIAVLDDQFYLHTDLGGSSMTRAFRATHVTGEEVVVKFVWNSDLFFDELANLYGCDESPYFCMPLQLPAPRGEWQTAAPEPSGEHLAGHS
jgi:hypothetical protein